MHFEWQSPHFQVQAYSDSDFAGCRETAKSTSGGVIMIGSHLIKSYSSTQKTVALSSAEAELTAVVKCSCETIGITQLAYDWGLELTGSIYTDSSSALAVVKRKGAGKLRHVRVGQLWVQQKHEDGELSYGKVAGDSNPADMLTKAMRSELIRKYSCWINLQTLRAERIRDSIFPHEVGRIFRMTYA